MALSRSAALVRLQSRMPFPLILNTVVDRGQACCDRPIPASLPFASQISNYEKTTATALSRERSSLTSITISFYSDPKSFAPALHSYHPSTNTQSYSAVGTIIEKEYKCPSHVMESFSQIAILDNPSTLSTLYDCPNAPSPVQSYITPVAEKAEISDQGAGTPPPAKEAKIIMRIRHKKMKKHKLKKLRKRMYFLWRKQKLARKAKRMTIYNKELEEIKKTGDDFDAEDFVKAQLAKARRGGYYINVFESKV